MDKLASSFNVLRQLSGRWLLLFLCLNPLFLSAQNYPTSHFTMHEGLPSMAIRCIYKDTRGLLWIGTDAGLCTFDGKSFRIFKPAEGMTANQVWAITEDEEGNIWFGSYGDGLFKFDGLKFERFTKKDGLVDDRIRVLLYSKNFHCLIAGCQGGVSTIKGNTITSSTEETFNKENGSTVTGLADAGKFIYVTVYGFINPLRFYPDKNKFISLNDSGKHYPNYSFSVYLSSKGDTIFSNMTKGVLILNKDGRLQNDTLGQVFGITEDERGDLWLAAWSYQNMDFKGGIFRYDGKIFRNYKASFGINDREIWTVFYDREQDILWIGTLNEGLFAVPFSSITNFPASYFNLEQQNINDVFLDSKNRLWISGKRELVRMQTDGSFSFLNKRPMIIAYRKFWKRQMAFPHMASTMFAAKNLNIANIPDFVEQTDFNFNKIIEDTDHSKIYSNELGLFRYDEKNNKTDYLGIDGALGEFAAMGDTLILSVWGATAFNPNYKANRHGLDNSIHFSPDLYRYFAENKEPKNVSRLVKKGNHVWYVSWENGLWMSKGLQLVHFNETDSTISNSLNDICFDEHGSIIFGSNTGEICIATYSNQKLKIEYRITSDRGLQGNSIMWLVADQKGKLWAGTNLGLNCINLDSLYQSNKCIIRFMDEENGYTGQSSKKAVMDTKGNLWIGAHDQLIRLDTKKLLSSQLRLGKVVLKALEINHTPVDSILKKGINPWTSLPLGNFKLKHSQNNQIFYFDLLNYNDPGKDRFRYMLRGYDKTWSEWNHYRRAVYTNLPPGQYAFSVESYNLQTLGMAEPLIVEFTIRHPWWGIWYLQILTVALLLTLAVLITRKYTEAKREKLLKRSEIEKKILQLEMHALQAQMNPHFIFNCMSSIQYYVLTNKMDEALAYLSDFSKVLRESLVNATQRMVPLENEIDFLHSYLRLEQMRFPDKFDYVIHCYRTEDFGIIRLPPMLIQPFAENVIRHGFLQLERKGNLSIIFEEAGNDLLKCTITDDGIGRKNALVKEDSPESKDRPHSTEIIETRIGLFNPSDSPTKYKIVYSDLSENGNPCGLKVELYLPIEAGRG